MTTLKCSKKNKEQKWYHSQASSKLNSRKTLKKNMLCPCSAAAVYCYTQVLNQLPGKPQEQCMRQKKQQNLEQRGPTLGEK